MPGFEPPKWPSRFLKKILQEDVYEEFVGDLDEIFQIRAKESGKAYARRRYVWDTVRGIRLINASEVSRENTSLILILSYFRTGFRFLWKTRNYSSINIIGLAFGITAAILANLFITDQFSFDRYHSKVNRIYRLAMDLNFGPETQKVGGSSYRMGVEYPAKISGIESTSRVKSGYGILKKGEVNVEQKIHYVDPEIFEILDFNITEGTREGFGDISKILISRTFKEKVGGSNEITMSINDEELRFGIMGVFEDQPINSTFSPEIMVPIEKWTHTVHERRTKTWLDINMNLLVLLRENVGVEGINQQMSRMLEEGDGELKEGDVKLYLQPYTKVHSDTSIYTGNGLNPTISEEILWVMSLVGILCLMISAFNYSNFSLGHFLIRSREVGVRKILGARVHFIWQQFFAETFISTSLALGIAGILVLFLLPYFSEFVSIPYTYQDLFKGKFLLGCLIILLVATFLSGSYPSIILSRFRMVATIKGAQKVGGKNIASKVFLTSQIGLAIFLIIGTITVNRQLNHLLEYDLGYDDERLISIDLPGNYDSKIEIFREGLRKISGVKSMSLNSGYNGTGLTGDLAKKEKVRHIHIDGNFVDQLGLEILAGRNLNPDLTSDENNAVLINETLAQRLGYAQPIGETLPFDYGDLQDPVIVGLVKDYHFQSPKYQKASLVMYLSDQYPFQEALIKMDPNFSGKDFSRVEELWNSIFSPHPFSYNWIEDYNKERMRAEIQIRDVAMGGSIISILLVIFGLLSVLGTYIQQRMKEIVIRKINGSRTIDLFLLFSRRFSSWLFIGFIIGAWPAYFFFQSWLNDYAQRVNMGYAIGLMALLICFLVFLGTMVYQMIKISRVNPVYYLSDE